MGAMILIFAFVMSLIINVAEKVVNNNHQSNKGGEPKATIAKQAE